MMKKEVEFIASNNGYLKIWRFPNSERRYYIGADVAEGLEGIPELGVEEGDYSCAIVISDELEQVAEWWGHIAPDLFAQELLKLGYFYNTALLGWEITYHGFTVSSILRDSHYPNLYIWEGYSDDIRKRLTKKLGWETNVKTKPIMIDDLEALLRERHLKLYSEELIYELMTYVKDAQGGMNAQYGCHDDRVIALAIAIQMWKTRPSGGRVFQRVEEEIPLQNIRLPKIIRESSQLDWTVL